MKTTTRKSMLYKTKVEYGDYTMNHVLGCSHGCRYPCYAMMMAKRFGTVASYEEWCDPVLVSNTLELLDREIPKLKDKINHVQLCFTTDSFMYGYPEICAMSLRAIAKLNEHDIPCIVLTKGVLPLELAEFSQGNIYGITLVSLDEAYRSNYEPGAAPYRERIASLRALHDRGCRTWVSMEPYPSPNIIDQELEPILQEVSFADRIIFGRTNYNKTVSSYPDIKEWYNERAQEVITFCQAKNIDYYIKRGTLTGKNKGLTSDRTALTA
ncbi:radical SAM protein [uncultured Adlercreutzia sp.]|uniref:radical SAM protein n=1 Tax=uncultured Adlercreutzia sp. TaxID=875803 RepID=UPI0025DEC878|nr:radical SAM protein [uncultured Adlercreutzia sp.]MCI9260966.1 radical SAM protein [Eggerthellaceae bacterium]